MPPPPLSDIEEYGRSSYAPIISKSNQALQSYGRYTKMPKVYTVTLAFKLAVLFLDVKDLNVNTITHANLFKREKKQHNAHQGYGPDTKMQKECCVTFTFKLAV